MSSLKQETPADDEELDEGGGDQEETQNAAGESATNSDKDDETGTDSARFVCNQCNCEEPSYEELMKHCMTQHEASTTTKMFQCDICYRSFSQAANMRRHRMRHTGIRPYECRVCSKRFFRKDHLDEHMFTHSRKCPQCCPVCGKCFFRQSHLKNHMMQEHPGTSKKICKLCGYHATSLYEAQIHAATHQNFQSGDSGSLEQNEDSLIDSNQDTSEVNQPEDETPRQGTDSPVNSSSARTKSSTATVSSSGIQSLRTSFVDQRRQKAPVTYSFDSLRRGTTLMSSRCSTSPDTSVLLPQPLLEICLDDDDDSSGCCRPGLTERTNPEPVVQSRATENDGSSQSSALTCIPCGIRYPDQTLYFLHKGVHSETNPWKCNICGTVCRDKYDFNTHILSQAHC